MFWGKNYYGGGSKVARIYGGNFGVGNIAPINHEKVFDSSKPFSRT